MSIDYGLGRTNIDVATGIRFGVISQHTVGEAWYEDAEPQYGEPRCPKCGDEVGRVESLESDVDDWEHAMGECTDFACERCTYTFGTESAFGDEPIGYTYCDGGYELTDCLETNIMIIRSPFYTLARFCSPCVPGAGDLDSPDADGVRSYCLGHEWFEGGQAPYPVYRVETNERVDV